MNIENLMTVESLDQFLQGNQAIALPVHSKDTDEIHISNLFQEG
jgi:hypothetical protein